MEYLLTTHHLTKTYGRHKAVDGVSLHLRQGDIYGLIGRNGAGKTTLLKLLSGLAAPHRRGLHPLRGHRPPRPGLPLPGGHAD